MQLHVVGGFLGSGKTTAIASAARQLMARGQRVGIVTNDQGRYLVDTAFFQALQAPAVEVTGGCFCCHYDDLDARLSQLEAEAQPDIVFAESVGSCADVVATVIRPLLTLRQAPASLTVFADARLLRQRLLGSALPFADDVIYIFDKQIEEAGLLVVNKADLLTAAEHDETLALARAAYPGKTIRAQRSLDDASVAGWLALLEQPAAPPDTALDIDYERYSAGEAALAWLDLDLALDVPAPDGRAAVVALVSAARDAAGSSGLSVAHLKFFIQADGQQAKISVLALGNDAWAVQIPALPGGQLTLLVNARVQGEADTLRDTLLAALRAAAAEAGVALNVRHSDSFHPGRPTPTHRMLP
jgi:Ni2+-binding GTPase involved in maturation of urease and hydrogenase